jgi:hypothetical protein
MSPVDWSGSKISKCALYGHVYLMCDLMFYDLHLFLIVLLSFILPGFDESGFFSLISLNYFLLLFLLLFVVVIISNDGGL